MPHLRQTCGMAAGATKGSSIILCLLTHHPRELCNACLWALLPCCTQRCDLLCVTYVNHWHGEIQANDKLVSNDCRLFFYHISWYLEVLHKPLYFLFFASFRLLGSPYQVLQCSTHYLRAVKDPKTSKTSRLSTRSFRQRFVADANVYRQQIRVCVALIDAIKSVFIPNYHLLRIGVVWQLECRVSNLI